MKVANAVFSCTSIPGNLITAVSHNVVTVKVYVSTFSHKDEKMETFTNSFHGSLKQRRGTKDSRRTKGEWDALTGELCHDNCTT